MKRVISLVLTALTSLMTLMAVGVPAAEAVSGPVKVVSLGDSFAAGSTLDVAYRTDALCDRSSLSYPYLLKKFSQSPSAEVACGGAVTTDLLASQTIGSTTLPAQISAVTSSTKVVTLTIGGNDAGFSQLAQCLAAAMTIVNADARAAAISSCLQPLSDPYAFAGALYTMGLRLAVALDTIQAVAPDAQIFVSDYPLLLGLNADGSCPTVPVSPSLVAIMDSANTLLNSAIHDVVMAKAATLHVTFVDVAASFAGHGLCSTTPLINVYLHPSAAGQQVYADVFNTAIKTTFAG